MNATDLLRQRNPSQIGNDALGDSEPAEMKLLKYLAALGSGLGASQMVTGAGKTLAGKFGNRPPTQAPWSQSDMMAARLRAQAQGQSPIMKADRLAEPMRQMQPQMEPLISPMHGNIGGGSNIAENGFKIPQPQEGGLLSNQQFHEFMKMLLHYHRN